MYDTCNECIINRGRRHTEVCINTTCKYANKIDNKVKQSYNLDKNIKSKNDNIVPITLLDREVIDNTCQDK